MHTAGVAAVNGAPVYRPVTWVKVRADRRRSKWVAMRCLIDEGCEISFISSEAARKLGFAKADGRIELTLSYFGGRSQRSGGVPRPVKLQGLDDGLSYAAVVCELEQLQETMTGVRIPADCRHLEEALPHIPQQDGPLEMIIGYDLKGLMLPSRVLAGTPDQPVAVATKIAWMIVPPIPGTGSAPSSQRDTMAGYAEKLRQSVGLQARRCALAHCDDGLDLLEESDDITAAFLQWAKGDLLGVAPTMRCACTAREVEEAEFIAHVRATMRLDEGRVEAPLPWRAGFPGALANNRDHVAVVQRKVMERMAGSNLQEAYQAEMDLVLDQFAEPVPEAELNSRSAWYLIHFPVQNRTKLRIVWNAAQKSRGLALNDGLHKGPVLLNNLMAIIHGFRSKRVPVAGDIKKMYNQVQLAPRDRDYHRFLWKGRDFRWKRLVFGDKPAPDVAIAALHFLADRAADEYPEAAKLLHQAAYMDDIIFSVDTQEEASQAMTGVSAILQEGAFQIKKWDTSPPLPGEDEVVAILGVSWDRIRDDLAIRPPPPIPGSLTKRRLLAWIATLWDPLGMAAPAAVGSKIKLQSMWDCSCGWDEPLPDGEVAAWTEVLQHHAQCSSVRIPRWCGQTPWRLHVFCDAGRDAYGAVAWAVGESGAKFLVAKSQVAPLKSQTVPRLELMAVLLGVRLAGHWLDSVGSGTCEPGRIVWTDSVTVQHWVAMPSHRLKAFVAARVAEIHDWQHRHHLLLRRVPTEANPADWLTKARVRSAEHLQEWLEGPPFIRGPEETWPTELEAATPDDAPVQAEVRQMRVTVVPEDPVEAVLVATSRWRRRRRVLAWMLSWKRQHGRPKLPEVQTLESAQRALALLDQRRSPPSVPKGLKIFSDDGLLRVMGRLDPNVVSKGAATPIVLASGDLARTMMVDCHRSLMHCSARQLLHHVHVKEGAYVVRGRRLAQQVVNSCPTCRRAHQRLHPQPMASLPPSRQAAGTAPFQAIAVDFLETAGRRKRRAQGESTATSGALLMIFVCDATRAVHLEVSSSESAEAILKAWIRFTCRRGVWPTHVWSDAGLGLQKAARELKDWQTAWSKAVQEATPDGEQVPTFEWVIGVPHAPHRMGVVEALVKTVKRALRIAISQAQLESSEDWETLACKIVHLINGRPCDPGYWVDLHQEPISANDILYPYGGQHPYTDDPLGYRIAADEAVQSFWQAWQAQAPPNLLPRTKWDVKPREWRVNDLVLIRKLQTGAIQLPRGSWPKGLITKCHKSKSDGVVRRVTVKLASGRSSVVVPHHLILIFRENEGHVSDESEPGQ